MKIECTVEELKDLINEKSLDTPISNDCNTLIDKIQSTLSEELKNSQ